MLCFVIKNFLLAMDLLQVMEIGFFLGTVRILSNILYEQDSIIKYHGGLKMFIGGSGAPDAHT